MLPQNDQCPMCRAPWDIRPDIWPAGCIEERELLLGPPGLLKDILTSLKPNQRSTRRRSVIKGWIDTVCGIQRTVDIAETSAMFRNERIDLAAAAAAAAADDDMMPTRAMEQDDGSVQFVLVVDDDDNDDDAAFAPPIYHPENFANNPHGEVLQ